MLKKIKKIHDKPIGKDIEKGDFMNLKTENVSNRDIKEFRKLFRGLIRYRSFDQLIRDIQKWKQFKQNNKPQ